MTYKNHVEYMNVYTQSQWINKNDVERVGPSVSTRSNGPQTKLYIAIITLNSNGAPNIIFILTN